MKEIRDPECGHRWAAHAIERVNGRLEWVCPTGAPPAEAREVDPP